MEHQNQLNKQKALPHIEQGKAMFKEYDYEVINVMRYMYYLKINVDIIEKKKNVTDSRMSKIK